MKPRPDRFGDADGFWQKVEPAPKTKDWNPKPVEDQSD